MSYHGIAMRSTVYPVLSLREQPLLCVTQLGKSVYQAHFVTNTVLFSNNLGYKSYELCGLVYKNIMAAL